MTKCLPALLLIFAVTSAFGQTAPIGIFGDPDGLECNLSDSTPGLQTCGPIKAAYSSDPSTVGERGKSID